MKNTSMKNRKKSQESPDKVRAEMEKTRPTKTALDRAIKKSISKNIVALKILAKR